MYKDEFQAVCNAAKGKLNLLTKNPTGYFLSSMLAGLYVAFGAIVSYSVGATLKAADSPMTKVMASAIFCVALCLVICAGSDLFTGNVFTLTSAALKKEIKWGNVGQVGAVSYIGNFVGTMVAVALFHFSGVASGPVGEYFATASAVKMSYSPLELLLRGVLCNILVCLAVWCSLKLKSESGKLIMIFLCIFTFMYCGFEHSIANMGILLVGLLNQGAEALSVGGYFYNLALSTLGNIIGGALFVAIPYYIISKDK